MYDGKIKTTLSLLAKTRSGVDVDAGSANIAEAMKKRCRHTAMTSLQKRGWTVRDEDMGACACACVGVGVGASVGMSAGAGAGVGGSEGVGQEAAARSGVVDNDAPLIPPRR